MRRSERYVALIHREEIAMNFLFETRELGNITEQNPALIAWRLPKFLGTPFFEMPYWKAMGRPSSYALLPTHAAFNMYGVWVKY